MVATFAVADAGKPSFSITCMNAALFAFMPA
jgi:hypothetical protein